MSVGRRVFVSCWAVYTVFWTPYIVREHFPAVTLAEDGTLDVGRYNGWIDDIFTGPRGGAFINNNPGASLAGAIPLLLLRPVLMRVNRWNLGLPRPSMRTADSELFWRTLREGRAIYFLLVAFLTVALVMAPVTAATAAFLSSRMMAMGVPSQGAAWAGILYGLGTPVLFRTGNLNHNLLVGDCGIVALLLLWDPHRRPPGPARALVAGLLAGYAFLCDYSGCIVVLIVALYVWMLVRRSPGRWRAMAACAAGVLPGVAALAIYQAWAFGWFFLPSQHFMTPTAPTSHGYRGIDWPSPSLMWANFFDPRFGLFAYCPFLLLAFGAPFLTRVRYRLPRLESAILFLYFGLFVLFCAANQYSWLQPLTGFRYLVPVVPGLAILAVQAAQALPTVLRLSLAWVALAQSIVLSWAHENDIRMALGSLWQRHFSLLWMQRLESAGFPLTGAQKAFIFIGLALLLAVVWITPGLRRQSTVGER